ncbi:MAG: phosphotransferase family protein [Nocardiopsaceae bacterium]|jgi:aminoglycoside phosphotransferase (APT) family kinase protein|nr:phosphotransferase family protein [Nocardiopsaceae bacterium]
MADRSVPGVEDVPRLARWLADSGVPGGGLPAVTMIAGGRSNLTYLLEFPPAGAGDGQRPAGPGAGPEPAALLVLRRPPLGHVLPTAHDMAREYRVLSALHGTAVPVPRPLALCQDPAVIGAPFYVMEHVPGQVLRSREDAERVTPAQAGAISELFVQMLAAIHGLDVQAAGLAGFGRPAGYLTRQLARWQRQWELSVTREVPGYAELVARLTDRLPPDAGAGAHGGAGVLVHGDFRLDNMLLMTAPRPQIAAVLDWEMSTLGDPLADLGLTLVYWSEPGEETLPAFTAGASATTAPGFGRRDQLAARYAALTGRDLARLGYYTAFGCFKLAVVMEGIHARFLQGKTVGEGFEREGTAVPSLIERAHRMLDSDG